MKKLFLGLLLATVLPLQAFAQELWQEGTHYNVISDKASSKPIVKEFFSYWCPGCYRFEPLVKEMKKKLDKDTKFEKVHVNFMGFTTPAIQEEVTRGLMIARAVKQEEKLNDAIFDYIHKQRAQITGLSDVRNIFIINDVDAAEFDKLASSFGVNSMVQKNNKEIEKFRQHLARVPNFIINDKFQINITRDMTPDDIVDLVVWLSKQK
ncbi:thiol:disulfide interchange protein DsbA/DsbL [Alteromonas facilis]|uniref:thiol:disulfide interchange protein DsbA/DsbL n=1 Tax=Alteromonas facilis TaxID=2048004 RepID=UPI000C28847D|nr:thiol:disulfide interchange protein DsbA/DsbL [Alteromonas facilis]